MFIYYVKSFSSIYNLSKLTKMTYDLNKFDKNTVLLKNQGRII